MKFKKLKLNEEFPPFDSSKLFADVDDDYCAMDYPETMFDKEEVEGPKPGPDVGVADCVMSAINDEFNTIKSYNSIIATMQSEAKQEYEALIKVIQDITAEENKHVGQLQEILKKIAPNANQIEAGKDEAKMQMNEPIDTPVNATSDDTYMCTLSDVDDEM